MTEPWTDARIREAFLDDGGQAEYHDPINGAREQRRIAGEIFDAWIARHDAEVSATALRQAAADFRDILLTSTLGMPTDEWLRARADRLHPQEGTDT